MKKNILFCVTGVVLGFVIGFLMANAGDKMSGPSGTAPPSRASNAAPPLDPTQSDGTLPPGHPDVGNGDGTNQTGADSASDSALAQAAMDAADRNPRDYDAQMKAAATFYQLKAFDKVMLYLDRALAIKPNDADALVAMGDTKYDAGDYVGAAAFYERALVQQPNDVNVRTDLGNTYFQRTPPDYDRAIAEYRKSLAIDPKHEKTLQNIAFAAINKGDKATARDAIEKLAAVNPSNPQLAALRERAQ